MIPPEAEADLLAGAGGSPAEVRVSRAPHRDGALAAATLEGPPLRKPSLRWPLTYHQPLISQGWAASSQPHPSADNWIKALQSKTQFFPLPVPPIRKLI